MSQRGNYSPVPVRCHGRAESQDDNEVTGAGLRQHHYISGISGTTVCLNCHDDSNPAAFTPVGEDILPPYYSIPDAAHPNKPSNPCNPAGEENYVATLIGLDNDGDGIYDQNDDDCAPRLNEPLFLPAIYLLLHTNQ